MEVRRSFQAVLVGAQPPSGFKLGSPPIYFFLSTTAQFDPPIKFCINYNESNFKNEKNLKLFHFENALWVNITILLDTQNNIICGLTNSFSEFAILENKDVDDLIQEVKSFKLEQGIEAGLLDKLFAAKSAIERNKNKTAVNIMKAFINFIEAQRGKKITNFQSERLILEAQALIKFLTSNLLVFLNIINNLNRFLGLASLLFTFKQ